MSLRMRVVIGKKFHGGSSTRLGAARTVAWASSHVPSARCRCHFYSRRGKELLACAQIWVLRKENFGNKNLVRSQFTRRDRFVIFNMLSRVDQDDAGLGVNRVVIRPLGQHDSSGVH